VEAVFGVPGVRARLEPMITWPRRHDVVVKPSMVFELTQPVESFELSQLICVLRRAGGLLQNRYPVIILSLIARCEGVLVDWEKRGG
jgi:hypothetical protein